MAVYIDVLLSLVRVIIYLAVACFTVFDCLLMGNLCSLKNLIETHQKVSLIKVKVYFNLIKAHNSLNAF